MAVNENACLVCGKPLTFFEEEKEMKCVECGKVFMSNASCEDGHYICDDCHAVKGINVIMDYCNKSKSKNPIKMAKEIMRDSFIYMHGNEHHVLVGAVLLTAYKNAGGEIDLPKALEEMKNRGSKYPGGSCGFWGCCGAAVSTGMFFSIINEVTPLSGKQWGEGNLITSRCLNRIGEIGGPRCCKRNSFVSIEEAAKFIKEKQGIEMELEDELRCEFSSINKQCIRNKCPYYNWAK